MMQRFVSIAQMLVLLCGLVAAPAWPSTVTVMSNADSGANTLRAAIAGANAGDTIAFALQGGTTITLASTLTLAKDVTIDGIGSGGLVISGNHAVEVFWVNAGVTATITNLTIADGTSADSGGIRNQGTLTVANCTLRGNSSPSGAAIINQAILTLTNSTLSGNSASFVGGGLWQASSGTATIVNNTFVGNSAVLGGAIYSQSASASTITNNLFFGNDASSSGGSITDAAHAIGADHNLYWNNSDSSGPQGTNCGNCVSNTNAVNADPVLGILKYNGGATWTYLPGAGSAAIDAVPDPDSGVLVAPLQEANAPIDGHIGVLERLMLRQLVGEHVRELPHPLMASERATVDENDDVLGDVASDVLVQDAVERGIHPVVRKVQVVVEHFLCSTAAQILHCLLPSSSGDGRVRVSPRVGR